MKPSLLESIPSEYIIDSNGKKTAVILKIDTYKKLLEELEDAHLGRMAEHILENDDERYSLDEIIKENNEKNKK